MTARRWMPLAALLMAACAGPEQAMVTGASGQAGVPIVVSGGTPVALVPSAQPTATTAVVVTVRTPAQPTPTAPGAAPTAPGAIAATEPLAQKIVPPTVTPAPTRKPPAEPAERELWTLERAEADMDAGRHREALDKLEAGPLPADVTDLAAVDGDVSLGYLSRAFSEMTGPMPMPGSRPFPTVIASPACAYAWAASLIAFVFSACQVGRRDERVQ